MLKSQVQEKDGGAMAGAVGRASIKLRWREGEKAPCVTSRCSDTIVDNNTVYCEYNASNNKIYAYHIPSSNWSPIPDCPTKGFAIVFSGGLLTTVGGWGIW